MATITEPGSAPSRQRPIPSTAAAEAQRLRTHELFSLARATDSAQECQALLETVIEMHLDIAHGQATRYRNRGIPLDDLRQVAALALTKATRGYDVTKGHDFMAYAMPTIRGELRRHFRDHGWMVRPPRRIQELQASTSAAREQLSFMLGRSPEPREIAAHLGESPEAVMEAVSSDGCFVPASLDLPASDAGTMTVGELLPAGDNDHRAAEARLMLRPALGELVERDRQILDMRYHEDLTQQEIADRLGISQMQVCRLLTRILGQLRNRVGEVAKH